MMVMCRMYVGSTLPQINWDKTHGPLLLFQQISAVHWSLRSQPHGKLWNPELLLLHPGTQCVKLSITRGEKINNCIYTSSMPALQNFPVVVMCSPAGPGGRKGWSSQSASWQRRHSETGSWDRPISQKLTFLANAHRHALLPLPKFVWSQKVHSSWKQKCCFQVQMQFT